ncbi:MAG: hypothetical protein ACRCWP_07735 [Shewanella sp.]
MTQLMNMQDVQAKISEQVKVSMFNLIPDEKVQELVESEISAYFESGTADFFAIKEKASYESHEKQSIQAKVSPFRLLVWEQLNSVLSAKIQEVFDSPEFLTRCVIGDGDKVNIENAAMARQEKIAVGMASAVFNQAIAESLRMAVYDTRGDISQRIAIIMKQQGQR